MAAPYELGRDRHDHNNNPSFEELYSLWWAYEQTVEEGHRHWPRLWRFFDSSDRQASASEPGDHDEAEMGRTRTRTSVYTSTTRQNPSKAGKVWLKWYALLCRLEYRLECYGVATVSDVALVALCETRRTRQWDPRVLNVILTAIARKMPAPDFLSRQVQVTVDLERLSPAHPQAYRGVEDDEVTMEGLVQAYAQLQDDSDGETEGEVEIKADRAEAAGAEETVTETRVAEEGPGAECAAQPASRDSDSLAALRTGLQRAHQCFLLSLRYPECDPESPRVESQRDSTAATLEAVVLASDWNRLLGEDPQTVKERNFYRTAYAGALWRYRQQLNQLMLLLSEAAVEAARQRQWSSPSVLSLRHLCSVYTEVQGALEQTGLNTVPALREAVHAHWRRLALHQPLLAWYLWLRLPPLAARDVSRWDSDALRPSDGRSGDSTHSDGRSIDSTHSDGRSTDAPPNVREDEVLMGLEFTLPS